MDLNLLKKIVFGLGVLAILAYGYSSLPSLGSVFAFVNSVLPSIVEILAVGIIVAGFLHFTKPVVYDMALHSALRKEDAVQVQSAWSYFIWFLGITGLAISLTGGLSSLSVFFGLFAAGLAFALQQPLMSVVGWLAIIGTRPFKIGDRVTIGTVGGDVQRVKLFFTVLKEFTSDPAGEEPTGKIITVPNSWVLLHPVVNYTSENPYVWDEVTTSVSYESDLDLAKQVILDAATQVIGEVMKEAAKQLAPTYDEKGKRELLVDVPIIRLAMAPSGVEMTVRYLVPAIRRRKLRSKIVWIILAAFKAKENAGKIQIAYPHTQLVLPDDAIAKLKK